MQQAKGVLQAIIEGGKSVARDAAELMTIGAAYQAGGMCGVTEVAIILDENARYQKAEELRKQEEPAKGR